MDAPWQVQLAEPWAWGMVASDVAVQEAAGQAERVFSSWQEATVVEGAEPRDWSPLSAEESMVWARKVVAFGEVASEMRSNGSSTPRPCRPPNVCGRKHF